MQPALTVGFPIALLVLLTVGVDLSGASSGGTPLQGATAGVLADQDGDGLPDGEDADRDGDGIPNGFETSNSLDPDDPSDGGLDGDIDGWSNRDEYRFGTALDDAASAPSGIGRQNLFAADGAAGDAFGSAVATFDDTTVIGAPLDHHSGLSEPGAAYVFQRIAGVWLQQAKLVASDAAAGDGFGSWVTTEGDTAVVGAPDSEGSRGAAYVFTRSGTLWSEADKLSASDGKSGDLFGAAVSLSGDRLLVGAPGHDDNGSEAGAAYVFLRSAGVWSEDALLLPSNATAGADFGRSVSLDGDTAAVGAPLENTPWVNAGAAYVFARGASDWSEQARLISGDALPEDRFGLRVSLALDTLAVSAPFHDTPVPNTGAVYISTRVADVWGAPQKLHRSDPEAFDFFGQGLALHGDHTLAGADFDDDSGPDSGSAYLLARRQAGWQTEFKATAGDGSPGDFFGFSVDLSDEFAVIGATGDDDAGNAAGSATVISLSCGNLQLEPTEECDDGDRESGDGCASICRVEFCGDGILQEGLGESCDDGNDASEDGCSDACALEFCGDGTVQAALGEGCDDGGSQSEDGCSASCQQEFCGDGIRQVRLGERCDDGNAQNEDGCSMACQLEFCGDGVPQPGLSESCDDGGVLSEDGCSASCQQEFCGDGIVQAGLGDQCDDGNTVDDDGCSAVCLHEFLDADDVPDVFDADVDGDGIPNQIERDAGLDPRDAADALLDLDADGFSNLEEYRRGSDPNDDASSPADQLLAVQKIFAADGAADEGFGSVLAASGDTLLVGGRNSLYTFVKQDGLWVQEADLSSAQHWISTRQRHAIAGDTVLVGHHVYSRSNGAWALEAILEPDLPLPYDMRPFGVSAALSEDESLAFVGGNVSPYSDGFIHVFRRDGTSWSQVQILELSPNQSREGLGTSIAISGGTALVGSPGWTFTQARIFELTDGLWVHDATISGALSTCRIRSLGDRSDCQEFGMRVALDRDTALVGAPEGYAAQTGGAYLFTRFEGTWLTDPIELVPHGRATGTDYGRAVALSDGIAAVSQSVLARLNLYPFQDGQWGSARHLSGQDASRLDDFGAALAVSGSTLFAGAPGSDDAGEDAGAVYVFELTDELAVCGDGILHSDFEECDDGNLLNGDDCSSLCFQEYCGDGVVNTTMGEECDPSRPSSSDGCSDLCKLDSCGDGRRQTVEECDDRNRVSGDGCTSLCTKEFCGDGIVQAGLGETCDDANDVVGDGCSRSCLVEAHLDKDRYPDPVDADQDGDRIPDLVENRLGLDPRMPEDSEGDLDEDGFTNRDEYRFGTDPVDAADAPGEPATRHNKVFPGDGVPRDQFGASVSVRGHIAVVGAPVGRAAYVFRRVGDDWIEEVQLQATDSRVSSGFGKSVAQTHDTIAVGSGRKLYLFSQIGGVWSEVDQFSGGVNSPFGSQIAADDSRLAVGAFNQERVYVYQQVARTWYAVQTLAASDDAHSSKFGFRVALSGDTMLVGAPGDRGNEQLDGVGAAYLYSLVEGSWVERSKLVGDRTRADSFGASVGILGESLLVGAPLNDDLGADAGAVSVYARVGDVWTLQGKLFGSDTEAGDMFGTSIAMEGDHALIGARGDDGAGALTGAVYLFTLIDGVWTERAKLRSKDGNKYGHFGESVSLSGATVAVGAPGDESSMGAAYFFTPPALVPEPSALALGAAALVTLLSLAGPRMRVRRPRS